ncbi:hypothetical protein PENANT_c035G04578 [Penicillium antarcticum]|uniref:F-box domain-containing protein n=1 Tax=Penicillium antarcticum TaxID=416450 RepID=A0A1V6PTY5_9EURO|nr:uncharacterized protein N7508_009987 [Penicillium antarcticum]KAJ5295166.1 hypothetical protein N7508_009987 [Penicillium antarcticum]OQD80484.1 hypothetical protein PENANT_c035G04578 [Penicillium antarcticum]
MLRLPVELVQLILRHCETPAYFQAAFTSRKLFRIATGSRDVILHHLHETPGHDFEHLQLRTIELFCILMKRSVAQLYGAEFHADCTLYKFQHVLDTRASTLDGPVFGEALLVFKGSSTVHLVHTFDEFLIHELELKYPGKYIGNIEVLRTAVDHDNGLYVLHRFKPFLDQELEPNHPFVKHALQSHPDGNIFMAHYELDSPLVRMCAFPHRHDYRPLALSATPDRFAISWQQIANPHDHEVELYTWLDDGNEEDESDEEAIKERLEAVDVNQNAKPKPSKIRYASYACNTLASSYGHDSNCDSFKGRGPAVRLAFNDRERQLLYHYRAQTLYGSFQQLSPQHLRPTKPPNENECLVPYSDLLSLQFSIDIPFFATHQFDDRLPGASCHWQYLAFGIATHRVEQWTVACLLKSEAYPRAQRCDHVFNLARGRRFDQWEIMAQLEEFEELTTSQGSCVAASPLGTRIAVANWKTLRIWALEPKEVIEGNTTGYYAPSWVSDSGAIKLRPVVIQLDAVCSDLKFAEKEDELVAITDRGLMYLNVSPSGQGLRRVDTQGLGPVSESF